MCRKSILVVCALALCITRVMADPGIIVRKNILYSSPEGFDLFLNLAYPKEHAKPLKALMYLPGNGWGHWWGANMDRTQNVWAISEAAAKGYFAATVDYRPTIFRDRANIPLYRYPDQLVDARRAVRWIRAHATEYGVDATKMAALGFSSGAHLALLLGLLPEDFRIAGESGDMGYSSKVQAVVSCAGPVELTKFYKESAKYPYELEDFMGGPPEAMSDKYLEASPLHYVTSMAPPILILHGTEDPDVPMNQETMLVAEMKKAGADVQLVLLPNVGHVSEVTNGNVYIFLRQHLDADRSMAIYGIASVCLLLGIGLTLFVRHRIASKAR